MKSNNSNVLPICEGYRLIFGYIGVILIIIGCITLLPLLTLLIYPSEMPYAIFFIIPAAIAIIIGYFLYWLIRDHEKGQLRKQHDCIVVVIAWICAVFFSAMPFFLTKDYTFTHGIFEAMSGWSTTGLSIVDVENAPNIFIIHRSITLFFGGVGLVLVMLSVLSDSYGMNLYHAEGHNDRLLPNLLKSSRMIISIYSGYILAGIILYTSFGMPLFDSINHSISAVSTGGFSNHAESIGFYNSVPIEVISIILMILGNTNFLAHLFLVRGKFKNFFNYCEFRFTLCILAFFIPIIAFLLSNGVVSAIPESFRIALFQSVSALTTTGFQTIPSFVTLPTGVLMIIIVLHLIGGGIGSTAGGIKQYRIYIALKNIIWSFQDKLGNKRTIMVQNINKVSGSQKVNKDERNEINAYIFIYILIFLIGTFIYVLFGNSLVHSMFEFSSALGTVGLSCGIINYDANPIILWVGTIGMFLGRLEIYVVFIALFKFSSDCRKKLKSTLNKKVR